jgi:hypothetical protein
MKTILRVSLLALFSISALSAFAGIVIRNEGKSLGGDKQPQNMTLSIDAGKLRMESDNAKQGKMMAIFDGDKQVMWMIDSEHGTYREMTAEQVQQMGDQMAGMMAQMQERMAQMPPEQRKMMEDMMKQRMGGMPGGGAAPSVTIEEKGSGEKVSDYTCIHYAVMVNGQMTQEIWAAPRDQVKFSESDLKTFQDMAKFFEPLARNAPAGAWRPMKQDQIKGLPVRTIVYEGGKPSFEWNLVSVEQKSLDGNLFAVPAGLKKEEMMPPGMGGSMGRRPGR